MFQRDYISRVIEEMSKVSAKILGLRLEGRLKPAFEQVNDYYKAYIRFDRKTLDELSPSEMQERYKMDLREIDSLAGILEEEGELLLLQENRAEAQLKRMNALELMDYVIEKDTITFSQERLHKRDLLKRKTISQSL
jgi:hypothetical protein